MYFFILNKKQLIEKNQSKARIPKDKINKKEDEDNSNLVNIIGHKHVDNDTLPEQTIQLDFWNKVKGHGPRLVQIFKIGEFS